MALELVLARKAIAAAVLAPEHGARILFFVRISAMFGFVVAFEVTKVLSDDRTALLEARILSWLAKRQAIWIPQRCNFFPAKSPLVSQ